MTSSLRWSRRFGKGDAARASRNAAPATRVAASRLDEDDDDELVVEVDIDPVVNRRAAVASPSCSTCRLINSAVEQVFGAKGVDVRKSRESYPVVFRSLFFGSSEFKLRSRALAFLPFTPFPLTTPTMPIDHSRSTETFGSLTPFAEPSWYRVSLSSFEEAARATERRGESLKGQVQTADA